MIYIDYYNGSHGNFLEFVCNKIAGVEIGQAVSGAVPPFTIYNNILDGAAHQPAYMSQKMFHAQHYTFENRDIPPNSKVICIAISAEDSLQLDQISFARGYKDVSFDSDLLENNTFNKLNNTPHYLLLDAIIRFSGYNGYIITAEKPDCPRHVLRSYFQMHLFSSWWIEQRQFNNYSTDKDVYRIPYQHLYNETLFIEHIKKIATWADLQYNDYDAIKEMHVEFMKRQPYATSREKCNQVINDIVNNVNSGPDKMYLLEEAYVNYNLEALGYDRKY